MAKAQHIGEFRLVYYFEVLRLVVVKKNRE